MQLMGHSDDMRRNLRNMPLEDQDTPSAGERAKVVRCAAVAAHVILPVTQLTHEHRQASRFDETVPEDNAPEEFFTLSVARRTGYLAER